MMENQFNFGDSYGHQYFCQLAGEGPGEIQAIFLSARLRFNPQFSDENAACMIISDTIYAMLLTETFFKNFTDKPIVDAKQATEVLVCLSTESRSQVDEIVNKAAAAGGRIYKSPQDHGFMYIHSFEDLDGHQWEYVFMEPQQIQQ